jgi:glycosyltransferase involved in cell wall biosynthesis
MWRCARSPAPRAERDARRRRNVKILHVVPSYVPAWRYGGPIRSVHGLCKALRECGHEVDVFTTNADGSDDLAVPLCRPVDVEGVRVWYFPDRLRRLYWSPRMSSALQGATGAYDVVHLHSIYLWPTTSGARAARRAHVPYVLSPRGMLQPELIEGKSRYIKAAWIRIFERSNLRHAAAVHFTSSREAADARRLGLEIPRPVIVPNGADAANDAAFEESLPPRAPADPYVLFLGRISWEKGIDRLVSALPSMPGIRLVIAGQGDATLREGLERAARENGTADRVEFAGSVEGAFKSRLLRGALALVLPSHSESFGNVVLEAMAAGCPVVVTPEVGASEVVRQYDCGLVADGNPGALAIAIRTLADDPGRRAAMANRGRQAFEASFTWHAIAQRMARVYADAIEASGR